MNTNTIARMASDLEALAKEVGGTARASLESYAAQLRREAATLNPDKTIRELQTSLPWTIRYSRDFRASPVTHKDMAHALHHVSKAAGKLHGLADDMDHDRGTADSPRLRDQYGKYVADLVVCSLRIANTFPGGTLDLQAAVQNRILEKNAPMPGDEDCFAPFQGTLVQDGGGA